MSTTGATTLGDSSVDVITVTGTATFAQNTTFASTGFLRVSLGTTAQRPGAPTNGMVRYNTSTNRFEGYENSGWKNSTPTVQRARLTPTAAQTVFTVPAYVIGSNTLQIFVNGILFEAGAGQDYTETSATSVTLAVGLTTADILTYILIA